MDEKDEASTRYIPKLKNAFLHCRRDANEELRPFSYTFRNRPQFNPLQSFCVRNFRALNTE